MVEAVTLEDIKRVAGFMDPDSMVMTIVGQPEGLTPAAGEEKPGKAEAPSNG
jgi:hypothetical protein